MVVQRPQDSSIGAGAPLGPVNGNPSEYELVPHDQIEFLRGEIERVKRNPFGDTQSSKDLLTALDHLNRNVSKLVAIFETANDEIVRDYKDKANTEKINRVLEQNEKLARGIVVIADLLKELKELRSQEALQQLSLQPSQPAPQRYPQESPPPAAPLAPEWQQAMNELSNDGMASQASGDVNPFLEERPGGQYPQRSGPFPVAPQQRQPPRGLPPIDFSDVPPPPPR